LRDEVTIWDEENMPEPLIVVPAPAYSAPAGSGALLILECSNLFHCLLYQSWHQVTYIVGNTLGTAVVNSDRHQLSIKMQVIQAIASCGSSLQLMDRHYCIAAMTKGSQSVRFD